MNVYGSPGYSPYYGPTGKVNFGWINEAWEIFKRDAGTWIGVVAVYGVIYLAITFGFGLARGLSGTAMPGGPFFGSSTPGSLGVAEIGYIIVLEVFVVAYMSFASASLFKMALKAVRRQPVTFSDGFSGGPAMGSLFVYYILYSLGSLLGLVALIVGAAFVSGLMYPGLALACDGVGPITAMRRSIAAMKADWLMGGLFVVVMGLLMIAGTLACYVGLLIMYPIYHLCSALAYRDMVGMDGIVDPQAGYGYYPGSYPQAPTPGIWPPPPDQAQTPYGQQQTPPPYGQQTQSPYGQPQTPPPYGQQPQSPYGQQQPYGQQPQQPYGEHSPYREPRPSFGQPPSGAPTEPQFGLPTPPPPTDPPGPGDIS